MDYTTDEIVQTLSEMGFSAEPDALEELRQELIGQDDNEDYDDIIEPFLEIINEYEKSYKENSHNESFNKYPQIEELIRYGHESLLNLYNEMAGIDNEIAAALNECDPELRQSIINELNLQEEARNNHFSETLSDVFEEDEEQNENIPAKRNAQRRSLRAKSVQAEEQPFQPTGRLPQFEFDEENQPITLDRNVEQALIKEVLERKGAVRVNCPPVGKAPFKHDPVKRNAQYRECWKKFPVPGEKRRASLRWKIRDIMIKRDIPHLQLIPNPGFQQKPDWME